MKDNTITFGDRFAAAAVIAIASFLTGLFLWGFNLFITMAGSFKAFLPFSYVWYFVAVFVILAFFSPSKALNLIGKLWKALADVFSTSNRSPWSGG